jgi:predicted ribosome quality control (RQC) complex YloA/Tae2 family protein
MNTVSAVMFEGRSLEQLQVSNPTAYSEFLKEKDRFTNELVILDGNIDKDVKLRDAFKKLQAAENVRDKVPDAYQQARSNYYTLKDGEKWKETEKERLLKAEVDPIVQKLAESKNDALRQYETQRKTVDVVNGLKDKVLSLKDEVKYAANTFKDQIDKVEDAIRRERKLRSKKPEPTIWDWLDSILNILIVASLLYVLYSIYQKYTSSRLTPYGSIY